MDMDMDKLNGFVSKNKIEISDLDGGFLILKKDSVYGRIVRVKDPR